jgi:hypothetical protein
VTNGEPFVFVDRSLGRLALPRLLRAGGIQLATLAEHYGIAHDETVEDTTWIAEAAQREWLLFMKDERIRRRPAEQQAIWRYSARCFCMANANLTSAAMAERYLANWPRIRRAADESGPYLYAVHVNRIERLQIGDGL